MKGKTRAAAAICFIALYISTVSFRPAYASENNGGNPAYTHSYSGTPSLSPDPYTVERLATGEDIGCGAFVNPADLFADAGGNLLVADTDNNRIVLLDGRLGYIREYKGALDGNGKLHKFNKPSGVFAAGDGIIYVADTENSVIVKIDYDGRLAGIISQPEGSILPEGFRYNPTKLVVDGSGRIHVISRFVNQGIIEFSPEGRFEGFLAAGKVNPNPAEIIWKKISTRDQRDRMADFVPIDYNNLALDDKGFLYATLATIDKNMVFSQITSRTGTEEGALVRRLNMMGQDILRRKGFFPTVGDVDIMDLSLEQHGAFKGISRIVDVSGGESGTFSILDSNRKHIFTYDADGSLLFSLGGADISAGGLKTPVSLAQYEDRMYVLDNGTGAITVFKLTGYGQTIYKALAAYEGGRYDESAEMWEKALNSNANMDLAYSGIGKAMFRAGEYKNAMDYFKLGHNKAWYSRAYKEHRKAIIAAWLPWVVLLIIALSLLAVVRSIYKKKSSKQGLEV